MRNLLIGWLVLLLGHFNANAQDTLYHYVVKNESLSSISLKYNKRIDFLIRDNSLKSEDIFEGQLLKIVLPADSKYLKHRQDSICQVKNQIHSSIDTSRTAINDFKTRELNNSRETITAKEKEDVKSEVIKKGNSSNFHIYESIHNHWNDSLVQFVIDTNIVLAILTFIMLIIAFGTRSWRIIIEGKRKRYETLIEEELTEYLFSDEVESSKLISNKIGLLDSPKNRFQLIWLDEMILKLKKDLIGEAELKMDTLYESNNLIHVQQKKLHSRKWNKKATAIHEIGLLDLDEFEPQIRVALHHSHPDVRFAALLTLIKLKGSESLLHIVEIDDYLTDWKQIQLFYVLDSIDINEVSLDKNWLLCKNTTIVLFAVRLARQFNRHDWINELVLLLNHPNLEIRLSALKSISLLGDETLLSEVKKSLKSEHQSEVIAAIKAAALLDVTWKAEELIKLLRKDSYTIRLAVMKTIFSLQNGIQVLERIVEKEHPLFSPLAKHALDRRISL